MCETCRWRTCKPSSAAAFSAGRPARASQQTQAWEHAAYHRCKTEWPKNCSAHVDGIFSAQARSHTVTLSPLSSFVSKASLGRCLVENHQEQVCIYIHNSEFHISCLMRSELGLPLLLCGNDEFASLQHPARCCHLLPAELATAQGLQCAFQARCFVYCIHSHHASHLPELLVPLAGSLPRADWLSHQRPAVHPVLCDDLGTCSSCFICTVMKYHWRPISGFIFHEPVI